MKRKMEAVVSMDDQSQTSNIKSLSSESNSYYFNSSVDCLDEGSRDTTDEGSISDTISEACQHNFEFDWSLVPKREVPRQYNKDIETLSFLSHDQYQSLIKTDCKIFKSKKAIKGFSKNPSFVSHICPEINACCPTLGIIYRWRNHKDICDFVEFSMFPCERYNGVPRNVDAVEYIDNSFCLRVRQGDRTSQSHYNSCDAVLTFVWDEIVPRLIVDEYQFIDACRGHLCIS